MEEKEVLLYRAALELGAASATSIAKKADIQRTHFYDLADKLLSKGLLRQIAKGKQHVYEAADPSTLIEFQRERLEKLQDALPELKALFNTAGKKPKVFFYEGYAGIDLINEDMLQYKGEIIGFTTPRFASARSKHTGESFIKKRVMLGLRSRVIGEQSPEVEQFQKRDNEELRETRILSKEVFHSEIEIVLYGNRMAIVDYRSLFGLIIEGSDIVSAMKMIFELVWSRWNR